MQPKESPRRCSREDIQVEHKGLGMPVPGPAVTQHKGLLWPICPSTASSLHSCHEFLGICPAGAGRAKVFSHYCFRRGSRMKDGNAELFSTSFVNSKLNLNNLIAIVFSLLLQKRLSLYQFKIQQQQKQSALSPANPCSLPCHCISVCLRFGWVHQEQEWGWHSPRGFWWHLGISGPLRLFLEMDAFLWELVSPDFIIICFYVPTSAGCHSQPVGSPLHSQAVVHGQEVIGAQSCPSREHWGLLQKYCTHSQVSFWVGKFVCLFTWSCCHHCHLCCEAPQHPHLVGTGGCCHLCGPSQAEGAGARSLGAHSSDIAVLDPKCRQIWRAASTLCSSCSSLIPKSFSWLTWITFSFFKYVISMTDINVKHIDEEQK